MDNLVFIATKAKSRKKNPSSTTDSMSPELMIEKADLHDIKAFNMLKQWRTK